MFNKKNDPLVDAVKQVMSKADVGRRVQRVLNEELGIESRNALPNEYKDAYDAALNEVQQVALDEVSDKTLHSYLLKSVNKRIINHSKNTAERRRHKADLTSFEKDRMQGDPQDDDEYNAAQKMVDVDDREARQENNYNKGNQRALKRLKRLKEEQLDEVFDKTREGRTKLKDYLRKATNSLADNEWESGLEAGTRISSLRTDGEKSDKEIMNKRKVKNRDKGIRSAISKIDEVFDKTREGRTKLKDYLRKATNSLADNEWESGLESGTRIGSIGSDNHSDVKSDKEIMNKRKVKNRDKGIRSAIQRIAEEYPKKNLDEANKPSNYTNGTGQPNSDALHTVVYHTSKGWRTHIQTNSLKDANRSLDNLKSDGLKAKIVSGSDKGIDEESLNEARAPRITRKTPRASLSIVAKREDEHGDKARAELKRRDKLLNTMQFPDTTTAKKRLEQHLSGKKPLDNHTAKRLMRTLDIHPSSKVGMTLKSAAASAEKAKTRKPRVKKVEVAPEVKQPEPTALKPVEAPNRFDEYKKRHNIQPVVPQQHREVPRIGGPETPSRREYHPMVNKPEEKPGLLRGLIKRFVREQEER